MKVVVTGSCLSRLLAVLLLLLGSQVSPTTSRADSKTLPPPDYDQVMAVTRETERIVLLRRLIETGNRHNRARARLRLAEIFLLQDDQPAVRQQLRAVDLSQLDKLDKLGFAILQQRFSGD